jgi:hypothetical protein
MHAIACISALAAIVNCLNNCAFTALCNFLAEDVVHVFWFNLIVIANLQII